MKIVFLGNYFNHHQALLSDALYQLTNGEYCFVETETMPQEQRLLGYPLLQRSYVLPFAGNEEAILHVVRQADAVIAGSAPEGLIRQRIQTGKLLFRYSERPLRAGMEPLKYLPRLLRWHWRNPTGKPIYLLSAGAFAAGDYAKFGLFRDKAFQWGYFPEWKPYDIQALQAAKNRSRILWCGRFLELKHPEAAIRAAAALKSQGFAFTLTMVGSGPLESSLKELTAQLGLEDTVLFPGSMSPEQVRSEMERTGIFLFTSDRREGWGVVVNEAMNSGCAVIASSAPGSVPYLLKNGENGLIYPSGDEASLIRQLRFLLEHPEAQMRLGNAGCETIRSQWNPELAAQRLVALTQCLLEGGNGQALFSDGPCSPVKAMNERWFG